MDREPTFVTFGLGLGRKEKVEVGSPRYWQLWSRMHGQNMEGHDNLSVEDRRLACYRGDTTKTVPTLEEFKNSDHS